MKVKRRAGLGRALLNERFCASLLFLLATLHIDCYGHTPFLIHLHGFLPRIIERKGLGFSGIFLPEYTPIEPTEGTCHTHDEDKPHPYGNQK